MHPNIKPRKHSRLKQPNIWFENASNIRNFGEKDSFPVDAVRVIVTATNPNYNSHVFLRRLQDVVGSIKKDWCRLEGASLNCVDFYCGNRSLPDDRCLSDIEESYPGIIDIICVPSTKGLVRIIVNIDDAATAENDPLIILRPRQDLMRSVKLDVARALNVESCQVVLTSDDAPILPKTQIGTLKEKWPGLIDLKANVLSSRNASVQCRFEDRNRESQTDISTSKVLTSMSYKKLEKLFSSESIRIRVGKMVTFHTISPSDTLGALVDDMRASNVLMSISDIKINDTSLWCPCWRERRLQDCPLSCGEELVFEVPRQVAHLELFSPPLSKPQEWTVEVELEQSCWASIFSCVPELMKTKIEGGLIVVQYGLYFTRNGFWRRAVYSLNLVNARKGFYAEEDGEPIDECEGDHLMCEVLTSSSGIRGAANLAPILRVHKQVEMFRFVYSEQQQLQEIDRDVLFDSRALLLFQGLRLHREDTQTDQLFLQLVGQDAFCDLSSGSMLGNVEANSYCRWSDFFIVLFEGEALPRWPIPFDHHIRFLRRHGVDIQMAGDGRVRRHTPSLKSDRSEWTRPTEIDAFLHSVTNAIRRWVDPQFG